MSSSYRRVLTATATALTLASAALAGGSKVPSSSGSPPVVSSETVPGVALQGAEAYRFRIGHTIVTALSDGTVRADMHKLLRGTTLAATDAALRAGFLANSVEVSINCYVFRLDGRLYLVDTGAGELFGPGYGGRLVQNLAGIGMSPTDITDILVTHVHTDHTGGLVQHGRIMFPKATIHVGQPDLTFFLDPANAAKNGVEPNYFSEAKAMLTPYEKTGQIRAFNGLTEIAPGIEASIHPGHTPGSAFYELLSGGQSLLFVGDIIHVPSVQFRHPEITITYDVDQAMAAQVRERVFPDFARDRTLIAAPHLPYPGVGHVRAVEQGYEWVPVDFGDRDVR